MTLRYASVLPNDLLLRDIAAHVDWFESVLRAVIFPDEAVGEPSALPEDFLIWCAGKAESGALEEANVIRLQRLHDDLAEAAAACLAHTQSGSLLTQELYNRLAQRLEDYIDFVRRLGADMAGSHFSIDTVTGLRSAAGMKNEIERELDRRGRKSDVFCVCDMQIDGHEALKEEHSEREMKEIYAHIAAVLMDSLRSYDDGYFLGEGEYMLCLKHVELLDACAAMDRIIDKIAARPARLSGSEAAVNLTVSCGVAEPVPGDKIDDIFDNAKRAMIQAQEGGGNQVMEWKEKSALQQYADGAEVFD